MSRESAWGRTPGTGTDKPVRVTGPARDRSELVGDRTRSAKDRKTSNAQDRSSQGQASK